MKTIIIGTRGSKMALVQARQVQDLLKKRFPEHVFELLEIKSDGDINQGDLRKAGGKGAFVRKLDQALLENRIHLAVNSMKDIPNDHERTPGVSIFGVLPRPDVREALISRSGAKLNELPPGTKIGTGSPRRSSFLKRLNHGLIPVYFRGNADTRIGKLDTGEVDAILLAKSGLERIERQDRITEIIPPEIICPPFGAGIITIDACNADPDSQAIAATVSDPLTFAMMRAERSFLNTLRGDCHTACAGYCVQNPDGALTLRGMLLSDDGQTCIQGFRTGLISQAEEIGDSLAAELLKNGGEALIQEQKDREARESSS
jgi:hydroxymethylbilane synthase